MRECVRWMFTNGRSSAAYVRTYCFRASTPDIALAGPSVQDFLCSQWDDDRRVPEKKDRVWLASAAVLAVKVEKDSTAAGFAMVGAQKGAKRSTMAVCRTPARYLQRRRLTQGAPYKCPVLRELVWDWFVDMRRSVATCISPRFMILMARKMASDILKAQLRLGIVEPIPIIDSNWLLRFKRDKGITTRRPNMRYKCSRSKLKARLRAMWLNNIRVRRLAYLATGSELSDRIWSCDEKPLHFNESGSKMCRTLEIAGAPAVRLKENHAATRERASLMTTTTSDPMVSARPGLVPMELLFRAKTSRRTDGLWVPPDLKVTIQYAEKGSYRLHNMLVFLERILEPMTPDRTARSDYRVLYLDMAASHLDQAVVDFAWSCGYITLYHYGCTTGIAQVNDTDCHGIFERIYLELEQASFTHQQEVDPGSVSRRPQDVVNDASGTWRNLDHNQGRAGHKRVGISVSLDGSDDHYISREALAFWDELEMPRLRAEALAEVDARWSTGELASIADWSKVVRHPEDAGEPIEEGAEFEGDLDVGESLWEEDADETVAEEAAADAADIAAADDVVVDVCSDHVVVAFPGDSEASAAEAVSGTKRLRMLRAGRQAAWDARCPAAVFNLERDITHLRRGLRAKPKAGGVERTACPVLRRTVQKEFDDTAAVMRAERFASFRLRRAEAQEQAKTKKDKEKADEEKAKKAEVAKKIDDLPKTMTAAELAQPGSKGLKARIDLLERVHLKSPELGFEDEARWADVRDKYSAYCGRVYGLNGGILMNRINECLRDLKDHYKGQTHFNKKSPKGVAAAAAGDPTAFKKFYDEMKLKIGSPSQRTSVMV